MDSSLCDLRSAIKYLNHLWLANIPPGANVLLLGLYPTPLINFNAFPLVIALRFWRYLEIPRTGHLLCSTHLILVWLYWFSNIISLAWGRHYLNGFLITKTKLWLVLIDPSLLLVDTFYSSPHFNWLGFLYQGELTHSIWRVSSLAILLLSFDSVQIQGYRPWHDSA